MRKSVDRSNCFAFCFAFLRKQVRSCKILNYGKNTGNLVMIVVIPVLGILISKHSAFRRC